MQTTERLCRLLTLDFSMGQGHSCSKPNATNIEMDDDSDSVDRREQLSTDVEPKREGVFSSIRKSILRVNSRGDRGGLNPRNHMNEVPNSPRQRASTYSHVHDVVMYNLAEVSKHDESVPMGKHNLRQNQAFSFFNIIFI